MSCEPEVGRLLAVLAAHLPTGAQVLELGTGTGVGTAWLSVGLLPRFDVTVITVEKDPVIAARAAAVEWPKFVDLRQGDALELMEESGQFDLIFADAPAGKWHGLERTIGALGPHGLLIVDDMTPRPDWSPEQRRIQEGVRRALLSHPLLRAVELDYGSGVVLGVRQA